ncbi:MAG: hypothetical protein HOV83_20340 [Catenulispora sp.]|nr:hypothetical protein [Catenulispora sp.]
MDSTPEDLPFQLKEQARDRFEEYRAAHADGADKQDPAEEEDRLTPGPGEVLHEYRRLRHSADIAAEANRLAEAEGEPDS